MNPQDLASSAVEKLPVLTNLAQQDPITKRMYDAVVGGALAPMLLERAINASALPADEFLAAALNSGPFFQRSTPCRLPTTSVMTN